MKTSFSWLDDAFARGEDLRRSVQVFRASGFSPPAHAAEADLFARHYGVPGHDQAALARARILIVGGGGIGSWTALALVRSGGGMVTLIEPDRFDRTNAPRQLMFDRDLGQLKAIGLVQNLAEHMVAGGQLVAIPFPFEQAVEEFPLPADVALFLVDNNACRFEGVRFARQRHIPAVFSMLSGDGLRLHTFLQGPNSNDACLHCALPNLDATASAPCAAATIVSVLLAAAYSTFFAHRAIMGWPSGVPRFNWREADLLGLAPDRVGVVAQRRACPTCKPLT